MLRDAGYFNQRAVRLQNLLRDFSHAIEIRQLPSETPGCAEVYVYNDSGLCLYRPHAAHMRAILTRDERSRAPDLGVRFSELVAVVGGLRMLHDAGFIGVLRANCEISS